MDDLQLVIFDCDGVLVDSEVISNRVLAEMLTAEGLPTTLGEARRRYQGLLLEEVQDRAQRRLGRELPEGWLECYEHERAIAFRRELTPVVGAGEILRSLRAAGVSICVASQGKLSKTQLSLQLTGLRELFPPEELFSAHSVPRGKPHPDLFLHAAACMGSEPAHCAVVEDTPSGVTAAVAAGMSAFGYAADSDESALAAAGARTFSKLSSLPELLGVTRLGKRGA